MKIIKEFKEFTIRGNVVDMAIGIIAGSAYSRIVTSLVNDIIMPPIGALVGGINVSQLSITLREATAEMPAVVIAYGKFIQTAIDFLIISVVIFFIVKSINSLRRKNDEQKKATEAPSNQEVLLTEIRDLLKEKTI